MPEAPTMNVLFIASEADPYVKVGGLADVAGSLPRAVKEINRSYLSGKREIDIRLVIPFHPQIRKDLYLPSPVAEFRISTLSGPLTARVFLVNDDGLPVYLVGGELIDQESGVYSADLEADGRKYVFFSMACLELARQLGWHPDIVHANDWHTAAALYSLSLRKDSDPFFQSATSLLTIHNLPYLGSMTPPAMEDFMLPPADAPDLPAWSRQMALPLGILAADAIVAVSPGYAREILTEEYGSGLDVFLRAHSAKISGILNGLDTHKWNPATDRDLVRNFTASDLDDRLANKSFLQKQLGLDVEPKHPVLAMVTRLDPQKGVDLAVAAVRRLLEAEETGQQPLQVIFLGTGNPVLEDEVRQLQQEFPRAVRARIEFSEHLSHHIYAGADILLMPSRYEPCGLSQMIAMHYGCVPVARDTGGLHDTIRDPEESDQSTGFLFTPANPDALAHTIHRALSMLSQNPSEWREMQTRGMLQDFSWNRSAQEYIAVYDLLLAGRKNV